MKSKRHALGGRWLAFIWRGPLTATALLYHRIKKNRRSMDFYGVIVGSFGFGVIHSRLVPGAEELPEDNL